LYGELLGELQATFKPQPDKPEETPESVLRALWFAAAGRPQSIPRINGDPLPHIAGVEVEALKALVARKREGAPLAYITGREHFLGLDLLASPAALIPRKETEILGRAALRYLKERSLVQPELLVLDVCTGSGNLALAYAHHARKARVFAADLSPDAVELARRNAQFTGLADRASFFAGDLFAPFDSLGLEGRVDLVSCNPPYITSAKVSKMPEEIALHEPRLAFDGGVLGISVVTRLMAEAPRFLKPGGALCFELGLGQGDLLELRLNRQPWVDWVEAHEDEHGAIRALVAFKK
jgi:release factor glutamine methyltransferase